MKREWIWLDMDGTFVDLYGVKDWRDDLNKMSVKPYAKAKSLYNDLDLMAVLACLKGKGYNIGVISWGARNYTEDYLNAIRKTKTEWLTDRGYDLVLDKIIVTAYGVTKADTCRRYGKGILVDDEERNRDAWDLGETINANYNILKALEALLQGFKC